MEINYLNVKSNSTHTSTTQHITNHPYLYITRGILLFGVHISYHHSFNYILKLKEKKIN